MSFIHSNQRMYPRLKYSEYSLPGDSSKFDFDTTLDESMQPCSYDFALEEESVRMLSSWEDKAAVAKQARRQRAEQDEQEERQAKIQKREAEERRRREEEEAKQAKEEAEQTKKQQAINSFRSVTPVKTDEEAQSFLNLFDFDVQRTTQFYFHFNGDLNAVQNYVRQYGSSPPQQQQQQQRQQPQQQQQPQYPQQQQQQRTPYGYGQYGSYQQQQPSYQYPSAQRQTGYPAARAQQTTPVTVQVRLPDGSMYSEQHAPDSQLWSLYTSVQSRAVRWGGRAFRLDCEAPMRRTFTQADMGRTFRQHNMLSFASFRVVPI